MERNIVPEEWRARLQWGTLSPDLRETIEELAMYMFTIGRNTHDTIDEIKYGGRLVILNDGSRWEVDDGDEDTSEFWNSFDEVAVIDGKMYNLSDCESVDVTEDS